ncbi:uncharacterized protein LOC135683795 isoform X2 [Rhopilema esculentum]|uniref:uncharacterized protein LOC135683795 isoform X2 n=1 Tax=Rhopilema esculentum TaxID=499914 RepID=UPI0031D3B598
MCGRSTQNPYIFLFKLHGLEYGITGGEEPLCEENETFLEPRDDHQSTCKDIENCIKKRLIESLQYESLRKENADVNFVENLSPETKQKYLLFTPKRRAAFQLGIDYQSRREEQRQEKRRLFAEGTVCKMRTSIHI